MAQFIKTIQNNAFQNNLWKKGSKIIVGVSGGPDSSCLLDVLCKLAPKYDFELHIAHVNYGLRGKDSLKDELFVRKLSEKYKIPLEVCTPKKSQYKGNLESSLRDIRYEYFESLRKQLDFDLIAVAHNQDDQAETVLMRIIRGSGLSGLSCMKDRSGVLIRPLLQTSKADILTYLKEKKIKFRTDKSNKDRKFTRNRVRHGLLPYLEKNFNPQIKKTISEWSKTVASDYEFIDMQAGRFVRSICKNSKNSEGKKTKVSFAAKDFLSLHDSVKRQVIRMIFNQILGQGCDVNSSQVEEVIKLIGSIKKKSPKALISGLNVLKKGDNIDIFC